MLNAERREKAALEKTLEKHKKTMADAPNLPFATLSLAKEAAKKSLEDINGRVESVVNATEELAMQVESQVVSVHTLLQ